jgi:hypothetical protein
MLETDIAAVCPSLYAITVGKHVTAVVDVHDVVSHCEEVICTVGVGIPLPKSRPVTVTLAVTEVGMFHG